MLYIKTAHLLGQSTYYAFSWQGQKANVAGKLTDHPGATSPICAYLLLASSRLDIASVLHTADSWTSRVLRSVHCQLHRKTHSCHNYTLSGDLRLGTDMLVVLILQSSLHSEYNTWSVSWTHSRMISSESLLSYTQSIIQQARCLLVFALITTDNS